MKNKDLEEKDLIEIKNLKFQYDKKTKNTDIEIMNLNIPENQIVALLGPSGSGKTTLLNLILGFLKPKEGEIKIINSPKINEIGYIMQENLLYENISVFQNIYLSAKNHWQWIKNARIKALEKFKNNFNNDKIVEKYLNYLKQSNSSKSNFYLEQWKYWKFIFSFLLFSKAKKKKRFFKEIYLKNLFKKEIQEIAKTLEIENLLNKKVNDISGGQKQRVAFAKCIIKKTNLILMDEPFSALDAKIKDSTIEWLKKIQKEFNLSIIIVTHDQQDALKISDKILLLNNGKIQQFDNSQDIYENPQNLFTAKFIGFPEINLIKKEKNCSYYIRHNKMNMIKTNNGKYEIIDKKHLGDSILYKLNNNWNIVINDNQFIIGEKVNVNYDEKNLLIFDNKGERIYEKSIY